MTNEEKLKEIERGIKHPFYYADPLKSLEEDAVWLISRVKILTEALIQIRDYVDSRPEQAHAADCALMARQALNETGDRPDEK